uniref:Uncharacterized protein n=1 Tax=Romanomermis culicivorax TaxID=13658 RepID=A0A915HXQ3_ROMCU
MSGDQKYVTRLCDRIDYLTNNIDRLQKKTTDRRMQTIVSRSPRGHHSSMLISHVLSGGLCPFEFTRFYDICNNASSKDDQQKTLFRSKSTDLGSILSNGQFKTYSTTTFDVENAKIVPKNTNSLLTEFNPYKQTSGSNKLTVSSCVVTL